MADSGLERNKYRPGMTRCEEAAERDSLCTLSDKCLSIRTFEPTGHRHTYYFFPHSMQVVRLLMFDFLLVMI
jgi:hypothetical protein